MPNTICNGWFFFIAIFKLTFNNIIINKTYFKPSMKFVVDWKIMQDFVERHLVDLENLIVFSVHDSYL